MKRILCWIGLHSWVPIDITAGTSHAVGPFMLCRRCGDVRPRGTRRKSTPILITLIITALSVALYARSVYREAAEADKLRPKTVAGRSRP